MNDLVSFGLCMLTACGMIALIMLYNVYYGVYDSLSNATIGDVYNFRYFQPMTGDYERFLARIVDVRKLSKGELDRLNATSKYRRYDGDFLRSNTLVTCEMPSGDYRQFYAERSDMCRRTAVGGLLFRAGVAHLF